MHNNAYLVEYDRGSYSASNPVLEISVSNGKAFLAIGQADGDFANRHFAATEQIAVDVWELLGYLTTQLAADERQAAIRNRIQNRNVQE